MMRLDTQRAVFLLGLVTITTMDNRENMQTMQTMQTMTEGEEMSFVGGEKLFRGQLGSVAYMECSITNLNNMSMAWVRMKDSHILTVDRETFISDIRFLYLVFACFQSRVHTL